MSYVAQVFGPTLYIERTVAKLLNIRIFNGFGRSWIRLKPLKTQNDQSRTVHFCHFSQSINPTNSLRNSVEMECFVKWLTTEQTDPSTYKLRPMRWSPSNYSQSRLRNLSIPILWSCCSVDKSVVMTTARDWCGGSSAHCGQHMSPSVGYCRTPTFTVYLFCICLSLLSNKKTRIYADLPKWW